MNPPKMKSVPSMASPLSAAGGGTWRTLFPCALSSRRKASTTSAFLTVMVALMSVFSHSSTQCLLMDLVLSSPLNPFNLFFPQVATMCKERLHEILNEEINEGDDTLHWRALMESGFARMDEEVFRRSQASQTFNCRCELQTPHCDAVGSTAVIAILTRNKIVVSNCGDSRAVLCRSGVAIPLSSDHKVPFSLCTNFLSFHFPINTNKQDNKITYV